MKYITHIVAIYIYPDSTSYLREAGAILGGKGFYYDGLAGYDTWFASWPIGYPTVIAIVSSITGCNTYLSSKLISILCVACGLVLLILKYKEEAWYYSIIYINIGFLTIYYFTWSENIFILSILIWITSLAQIMEYNNCDNRWFCLYFLSMVGTFLTRYFGIFALIFSFFVMFILIIKDFGGVQIYARTIMYLFIANCITACIIMGYFCINYVKSGFISGVTRSEFMDKFEELTENMCDSLLVEICNAIRFHDNNIIKNLTLEVKEVIILIFLIGLIYIIYTMLQLAEYGAAISILAGLFYDILFIIVRFHSSMDPFGYRFWVPGSIMITIGVIRYFRIKYPIDASAIAGFGSLILVVLSVSMIQNISTYNEETTYYHKQANFILMQLEDIPSGAVILEYDGDYSARAFRPDIMFSGKLDEIDTIEELVKKYDKSSSIWIDKVVFENLCHNGIISDYFEDYINNIIQKSDAEKTYVCIWNSSY